MQKLFKNSKQILAFVMAFAVIVASMFTGVVVNAVCADETIDLLEFGEYLKEAGSTSTYWDTNVADNGETGDSWENAIIIDSAEEFVYLCKGSGNETAGKYYKVADGIKAFDLSKGDLNYDGTLEENLEKIKSSGKNHSGGTPGFQGHFDGNNVTVYGAWCSHTGVATYAGLFSCASGNVTIKNVNVKLSYFVGKDAAGGIVGYYKGDGIAALNIENCTITDTYLEVQNAGYGRGVGAIFGYAFSYAGGNNGEVNVKNCFVDLDEKYFISQNEIGTQTDTSKDGGHGGLGGFAVTNKCSFSNCIVYGITPYATTSCTTANGVQHTALESHFSNIYTDAPTGKINVGGSTLGARDFTGKVFNVTPEQMQGGGIAKVATKLDWENVWVTGADGKPDLRANHGKFVEIIDREKHLWKCEDCGFESYGTGTSINHNFVLEGEGEPVGDGNDVYKCADCGWQCKHDGDAQTQPTVEPGDCLTAPGTYTRCKLCDWYIVTNVGSPAGHQYTYYEADPGHCAADGRAEYWHCSVCDGKYTTPDVMAPFESAVTDEQLNTGLGKCIMDEDEEGVIVVRDANGHYFICKINNEHKLDHECNIIPEGTVEEHNYENAKCVDCGWMCTDHVYVDTGKIVTKHSCTTDEETEIKCEICEFKSSYVTKKATHNIVKVDEVKPDDRKEGAKAHYKCTECKETYVDAEGKTKASAASLVIPKVLPEEYRNMVNGDTGTKSPSTNDSLASVLSVAAFAGALLVIARKK